jgi:hypothetical protein
MRRTGVSTRGWRSADRRYRYTEGAPGILLFIGLPREFEDAAEFGGRELGGVSFHAAGGGGPFA